MNSREHPAVFLDRDGTIVRQVELLHDPELMRLLPRACEAIRLLNENGLKVVVVTNQPVVARGMASVSDVYQLHKLLNMRLGKGGAHIDAFYFCPHHINANVEEYRITCACRKPNPGMILKAAEDHNLNLQRSVMIGDTTQDIMTGQNAGIKTILVRTGHGGRDPWQYSCTPDFAAVDLRAAVELWLKESKL